MWELLTNRKLRIHPRLGLPIDAGRIEGNWLIWMDPDCYLSSQYALGIDECIITAKKLRYNFIRIVYKDKNYETTREFFWDKHVNGDLYNARSIIFLPKKLFGLSRSIEYGKRKEFEAIAQLDIFDLPANQISFEQWEKAQNKKNNKDIEI